MLAAIALQVPLLVLPILQLPQPTRNCQLETLSPQTFEEQAFARFETAVDEYARLQRHLARSLPVPPIFGEDEMFRTDDLREAIVAARPQARPGMFFTFEMAFVLRQRIDDAFQRHPGAGTNVVTRGGYEPVPGEPGPEVNQPFPAVVASVRWLPLVRALPPLPRELDFALWGRDLVLVDVDANLVLDILPEALPESAGPAALYP
jgi:hypothetical protein